MEDLSPLVRVLAILVFFAVNWGISRRSGNTPEPPREAGYTPDNPMFKFKWSEVLLGAAGFIAFVMLIVGCYLLEVWKDPTLPESMMRDLGCSWLFAAVMMVIMGWLTIALGAFVLLVVIVALLRVWASVWRLMVSGSIGALITALNLFSPLFDPSPYWPLTSWVFCTAVVYMIWWLGTTSEDSEDVRAAKRNLERAKRNLKRQLTAAWPQDDHTKQP